MHDTDPGITTGALARRLGVSPTTVRSWDRRYGIGPAQRGQGRHRRWSRADVAMLEEMCRLTASGVPPAEAARAARQERSSPDARDAPDVRAAAPARAPVTAQAAPRGEAGPEAGAEPRPAPAAPSRRSAAGSGLPLGDVRQECRGLARAAVRLDAPAMEELLRAALAEYGLVTTWEEIMAPTLRAVGRKWESSDDRYVEVEHLLSWHISTTLRRAAVSGPVVTSQASPVLLTCVPSEQHTLPLEALAAGLAERGVPTRMFGAAVPAEALDAAVRHSGPAAVVLWSQSRSTANPGLAQHIARAAFGVRGARTSPQVLLAGPGWPGRTPVPGTVRPTGLREALALISRLYGEGEGAEGVGGAIGTGS
ncbi:MerR family transcriptional regulator [Streptomyces showdoensis]|uniref:Transcriptional regulator n=1 Tax=Streptomyces showdoensis TaxID=68268 RepID=A0A2P2GG01_STREW|nr:MerR family transcriptional regulator [Streptomyces showdoensis]KKZ70440.1 transcriptional regulator [Streptomyces showdoensis]